MANLTKEEVLSMIARAEVIKVWVGSNFKTGCYLAVDKEDAARKAAEIAAGAAVVEFDAEGAPGTLYIESHP